MSPFDGRGSYFRPRHLLKLSCSSLDVADDVNLYRRLRIRVVMAVGLISVDERRHRVDVMMHSPPVRVYEY